MTLHSIEKRQLTSIRRGNAVVPLHERFRALLCYGMMAAGVLISANVGFAAVYPATPYISPASGTYTSGRTINISDSTSGATIYYTNDGSTPTTGSPVYSGPLTFPTAPASITIRAIAVLNNLSSSAARTDYKCAPLLPNPVFSPAQGNFSSATSVTIASPMSGGVVHYTTDGSIATASSPAYNGPISVTTSANISAIVSDVAGYSPSGSVRQIYAIFPTTPYISPAAGTYPSSRTVSISDGTPGAAIYYTTDGSTPTSNSTLYTNSLSTPSTAGSQTIRAVAFANGLSSSVATSAYTTAPLLAPPAFSPAPGNYVGAQSVTLSASGGVIYYTLDGSTPTTSSAVFSGTAIPVNATTIISAMASGVAGYSPSSVSVQIYSIIPTTPFITPAAGTYTSGRTITISDSTSGAVIYYTTDGTAPTPASTLYSAPFTIPTAPSSQTIRAIAVLSNMGSAVAASAITIAPLLPTPTFSVPAGNYTTVQSVTLTASAPGGVIHFTTDGSNVTNTSPVYSSPISVSGQLSIAAMVSGVTGYTDSYPAGQSYIVTLPTAIPVMSLPGGNYSGATISVTLSDSTPGAVIYYTLDDSNPTVNSPQYTSALSFTQNTSLRIMAVAPGFSASQAVHSVYGFLTPTPVISPASGSYATTQTITISNPLPGAFMFYTLDGSTPTTSSPQYTGPISLKQMGTVVVQAIAASGGHVLSTVSQSNITLSLPAGVLATSVVGAAPIMEIPTNFLGLSHAWGKAQSMMGNTALGVNNLYRTMVGALSTNMGGPVVIRVGGGSTDSSGLATPDTVEPFVELAQNVNVQFILGVNLGSANLSLAQEQATTFTTSLPSSALAALEIGNEADGYSANGIRPATYGYADFLPEYQQWATGVASAATYPVAISGPTLGTGFWTANATADVASSVLQADMITQHKYIACYYASNPLAADVLLQPSSSTASLWALQPYAAAAHSVNSKFRMAEINSICNGGQFGVSDTFSSALWAMDNMFEYVNAGIDGVNWNTNYDGGPYDLFDIDTWNHNGKNTYLLATVRPLYYGLLMFSQAAGHNAQLMPASTLAGANVKIWVTTDSTGNAHVLIINKEKTASGTVQITMPGYSTGTIMRLAASSYQATTGVTLAGQTFDGSPDGTLQGTVVTESASATAGVWTISVNPTSAVLVNLQP